MARTGKLTAEICLGVGPSPNRMRIAVADLIDKHKPTVKVYSWKCRECGHEHPKSDDLRELGFYNTAECVCITKCQGCGSYVIAYRWAVHGGEFLVVKAHNNIKGK